MSREYDSGRIAVNIRCRQCDMNFVVFQDVKLGGRDHMKSKKKITFRICHECAARNAAILYPDMRVITKH